MVRRHVDRPDAGRREDVVRVLRETDRPMSIARIAERLGVHPNTVRFHLEKLVENGRVERVEPDRRSPGRPPQLFRAVRVMDPTGPRHYRLLAEVLADGLATTPEGRGRAAAAGRDWGRRQQGPPGDEETSGPGESVDRLVTLLDELGFAPELRDSDGQARLGLRRCPFLELSETRSQIVCAVHLGLMQGALAAWRSPVTVDRLEAFVEPDLCLAHLTPPEVP